MFTYVVQQVDVYKYNSFRVICEFIKNHKNTKALEIMKDNGLTADKLLNIRTYMFEEDGYVYAFQEILFEACVNPDYLFLLKFFHNELGVDKENMFFTAMELQSAIFNRNKKFIKYYRDAITDNMLLNAIEYDLSDFWRIFDTNDYNFFLLICDMVETDKQELLTLSLEYVLDNDQNLEWLKIFEECGLDKNTLNSHYEKLISEILNGNKDIYYFMVNDMEYTKEEMRDLLEEYKTHNRLWNQGVRQTDIDIFE